MTEISELPIHMNQDPLKITDGQNPLDARSFAEILEAALMRHEHGSLKSHSQVQAGRFDKTGIFWASDNSGSSTIASSDPDPSQHIPSKEMVAVNFEGEIMASKMVVPPSNLVETEPMGLGKPTSLQASNVSFSKVEIPVRHPKALSQPASLRSESFRTQAGIVANQTAEIEDTTSNEGKVADIQDMDGEMVRELVSRESIQSKSGALSISVQEDEYGRKVLISALVNDLADEERIKAAIERVLQREDLGNLRYELDLRLPEKFDNYLGAL